MNIQEFWEKALKKTEIVRPRVQPLLSHAATHLPYICLSESSVNMGDTVVRKGEVVVEKPALVMPYNTPHFEVFDFEKEMHFSENTLTNFFLVRGVSFPSMKYNNVTSSMDVQPGNLSKIIEEQKALLQQHENVHSGLIVGPEDCWQFSILIFVASQIMRSADGDIRKLLDDHWKNQSFN